MNGMRGLRIGEPMRARFLSDDPASAAAVAASGSPDISSMNVLACKLRQARAPPGERAGSSVIRDGRRENRTLRDLGARGGLTRPMHQDPETGEPGAPEMALGQRRRPPAQANQAPPQLATERSQL